ncbi:amidase [Allopusillimonas soli]|uniref:Amidase n=1 Tax=Allopusillimonas soli TaxID=659016 RepID=A0A853F5U0_9BURK|nr:amidase [Allopusillimonas soli]NYT35905.1 amidase [Allopusillimonas soli]TEA76266.1 amidase [Allopusillimonas soli]
MGDNLPFASIEALSGKLERGDISSAHLTNLYLERIDRLNPALNAYVEVYHEAALMQARASDQRRAHGYQIGPLDGIPLAVKDLCAIDGRGIAAGSKSWHGRRSESTATAIARLIAAGAVILGKTQMVEFAFGGWGTNPLLGTPRNPWSVSSHCIPGGSSSGSGVAVAAGLAAGAIGSDTGGSVRIPATLNGITGLKTTAGLISLAGCCDLSKSLDSLGPMTRSVWDAALLTQIMAGYDKLDPRTHHAPRVMFDLDDDEDPDDVLTGAVIGLIPPSSYPIEVSPEIAGALDEMVSVLMEHGATVIEQEFPFDFHEMMLLNGKIISAEAYALHRSYIHDESLEIGPWVRRRIMSGRDISAAEYIDAMAAHNNAKRAWAAWMRGMDALLVPGTPIVACPLEQVDESETPLAAFTRAGNFLGTSVLAVPAGFDGASMPIGMQLYGKPFEEPLLVRIGRAYQRVSDWHRRVPAMV